MIIKTCLCKKNNARFFEKIKKKHSYFLFSLGVLI
jgi:hypothetical protein